MADIVQPHDRFLKALLSDPQTAGTLLRERLPKEISELLSPEPPELVDGSFVDEELHSHLSDRLFKAKTINGRTALLYVLIEHKSVPDPRIDWQLLKYMVEALKQWEREHPDWKRLPAIVPFTFYHGAAEWRVPTEFQALVDAEDGWRPYLLNFQNIVLDLGRIEDQRLSNEPRLKVWLLVMKYAPRHAQQEEIKEVLIEALSAIPEELPYVMPYMVERFERYGEQDLREIIRAVMPEEEEKMMSQFAQEVIAKEKPEWAQMVRQEGRQEGEATMLLHQLQQCFGSLPSWATEKVQSADQATLETWGIRIFKAQSLEELFADQ